MERRMEQDSELFLFSLGVSQECPVGLLVLWRTACFRGQTSMLAALWSISAMMAFTCWETPKCIAATVGSGEGIHLPVWVSQ